jgi:NarL family two-component system sensor histidine kinase YdfH
MEQRSVSEVERLKRDEWAGWPFLAITSLVIVTGYVTAFSSIPSLQQPVRLALFTVLMVAHGGLYWLSPNLFRPRGRLLAYLAVQAVLASVVGLLTPGHWLVLGLYMGVTGQAVGALWPDLRAIALVVFLCVVLSAYHLAAAWGLQELVRFVPYLGIMLAFVLIYVILFVRQVQARQRAQALLHELEAAHRQLQAYADRVEELTISQERQRMAQELHDTLAQGLAGLIMQLEAIDSHLESGNPRRAQETVQQAMQRARATLHEARRAIQALRPAALEQGSLVDALGREVDQFAATTGVRATFQVDAGPPNVPPEAARGILRIVQESLTNIARHAHASHVVVRLQENDHVLRMTVQDDGSGFDPIEALEQPGCFGLAGLRERAQRIGGVLQVESAPGRGTGIVLEIEEASL